MNQDVISCIPSKTLREYLATHPIKLSILQEATIISEYAAQRDKSVMFQRLVERSSSAYEKELLIAEATGNIEAADDIYRKKFPHKGHFPIYPFLEVCNLPVLFKPGDVIRWQNNFGDLFYYVAGVPYLPEGCCDFTDECYLCYSLQMTSKLKPRNYYDLVKTHYHIKVCEAIRASINKLTSLQRSAMHLIKRLIASKPHRH